MRVLLSSNVSVHFQLMSIVGLEAYGRAILTMEAGPMPVQVMACIGLCSVGSYTLLNATNSKYHNRFCRVMSSAAIIAEQAQIQRDVHATTAHISWLAAHSKPQPPHNDPRVEGGCQDHACPPQGSRGQAQILSAGVKSKQLEKEGVEYWCFAVALGSKIQCDCWDLRYKVIGC
jgi:hypothetical protein